MVEQQLLISSRSNKQIAWWFQICSPSSSVSKENGPSDKTKQCKYSKCEHISGLFVGDVLLRPFTVRAGTSAWFPKKQNQSDLLSMNISSKQNEVLCNRNAKLCLAQFILTKYSHCLYAFCLQHPGSLETSWHQPVILSSYTSLNSCPICKACIYIRTAQKQTCFRLVMIVKQYFVFA